MRFDPSKIRLRTKHRVKETDPEKIFESLTLRGSIENLWSPQAAALQECNKLRTDPDVVIEMNTGGGKTLVGLLIAQSLVNESGNCVLYVCPTNQLIEQASAKAEECGIEVASYMGGKWEAREVSEESRGPCITNYAAVFNGKSIFEGFDLGGIVFDDAHVAGNIIRAQFTLSFENGSSVYNEITKRLRPYFTRNLQGQQLQDAIDGDPRCLLLVPMFEVRRAAAELTNLLLKNDVSEKTDTLFAWEHIKDHLDRCVILISGSRIEITPSALPLHRLRSVSRTARRVYLTATLPAPAEFVKTFGIVQPKRISPKGKSGEAQRLFIFPNGDDDEQRSDAQQLIDAQKACVMVPSAKASVPWKHWAELYDRKTGQAGIDRFAEARGNEKLILVARYDGIDLPGDACRVLVLDSLPRGSNLLSRFLDERLQVFSLRASHTATRMVQAIGRIFRSNTDHGAVILCSVELHGWARRPTNHSFLPPLLQKQIQLGTSLRDSVDAGETTYEELLSAVLSGNKSWDKFYQDKIDEFDASVVKAPAAWLVDSTAREQEGYRKLWEGNAAEAASDFGALADDARNYDTGLAAWFQHWEGFCYECVGKQHQALQSYVAAANVRSELGCPRIDDKTIIASATVGKASPQAKAIAELFSKSKAKVLRRIDQILALLEYGDKTNPVEQALCDLGSVLGLDANRPDRDEKKGPDVKWHLTSERAGAALEAKTNKNESSQYQKKNDIGQFHDHNNYLSQKHPGNEFRKIIVGRILRVSSDCHPPADLQIIQLEQFVGLAGRLKELYRALTESDSGESLETVAERWLNHLGLKWPHCVDGLQSSLAVDLQSDGTDSSVDE